MTDKLPTALLTRLITETENRVWAFPGFRITWKIVNSTQGEYALNIGRTHCNINYTILQRGSDNYLQYPASVWTKGKPFFETPSPNEIELLINGMTNGEEEIFDWRYPPEVLRKTVLEIPDLDAPFEIAGTEFTIRIGNCQETGQQYMEIIFYNDQDTKCMWKTDKSPWVLGPLVSGLNVQSFPFQFTLAEYLWLTVLLQRKVPK